MLQHFTWQQFLVAALILSLIWYGVIILLFYRKQVKEFLSGKPKPDKPAEPLAHVWDEDLDEEFLREEEDLMGKPALPEGMSRLSMAQFGFAPPAGEEEGQDGGRENRDEHFENENTDRGRQQQQSVVPDVLEELKSIFHIMETEQGTKRDFISLFGLISSKYPNIKGTSSQQALNDFIRDNVLFPISDEELDNLWN